MLSSLSDRQIATIVNVLIALILLSLLWFAGDYIYNNYYRTDDRILTTLEKATEDVRKNPGDIRARVYLANVLVAGKQFDEAIRQYNEAIKINEKYGPALVGLGIAYWQSDNKIKALNTFKKEIKIAEGGASAAMDKYLEQAYFYQGKILLEQRSYRQAADSFKKALKIAPAMSDTYLLLGQAEKGMGKRIEALKHIKKALELNPGSVKARKEVEDLGN